MIPLFKKTVVFPLAQAAGMTNKDETGLSRTNSALSQFRSPSKVSIPLQGLSLSRSALNKVRVAKVLRSEPLDSRLTRSDSFLAKAVGGSFLTPNIWQKVFPLGGNLSSVLWGEGAGRLHFKECHQNGKLAYWTQED